MTILNFTSSVLVAHELAPAPAGYVASSVTSLALTTGSKTFTTQVGLAYKPGQRGRLLSASAPANYMEGQITAYSGPSMTMLVDFVGPTASGTHTDWSIAVAGEKGAGDILSTNNGSDFPNKPLFRSNVGAGDILSTNNGSDFPNKPLFRSNVGAGDILSTNNGSDFPNKPLVRTNLGISGVSGPNQLPNSNWQLFSKLIGATSSTSKVNVAGTGLQSAIFVTSFTPSSGNPTLLTANTQDLANGDLVVFGAAHAGLSGWALRVVNLVPNVSFGLRIPFSQASPGSSSLNVFPMSIYEPGASSAGPDDGWSKTPSLVMWADDIVANACPGAKRVLGLRKGAGTGENFKWNPRTLSKLRALRGRRIAFGALIRQKVGAAAAKIYINDGTTVTYSSVLTGAGFVDANYNNYQFVTVSALVSATTAFLEVGLEFDGSTGDICYVALPTLKFGQGMTVDDLGQNPGEWLRADTHWNPACLVPFGSGGTPGNWPGAEIIAGSGLYGWSDIDLEAISYGQCHSSVAKANAKIEYQTSQVGSICFVGALDIANVYLTFALQAATLVANQVFPTNMSPVPLITGSVGGGSTPGCFTMFSNENAGPITQITYDFDDVLC